jgi:integrase
MRNCQRRSGAKPLKPEGCPLTPSGGGSWVKKIGGKTYAFGAWHDLEGALKRFYSEVDFIRANGIRPEPNRTSVTVEEIVNQFLKRQNERAEAPEDADEKITDRHYNDLWESCNSFVNVIGKLKIVDSLRPSDFEKAAQAFATKSDGTLASPSTIAGHIRRTKAMLNWAYDAMLIDRPIRTGKTFRVPSKKTFRKHRNLQPEKVFSPSEIHGMIAAAPVTIKAAIWLGINCGLNNSDVGKLPLSTYLERKNNWLTYARSKNAVFRKLPLWPETQQAIDVMLGSRVEPNSIAARKSLFLTRYGNRFGDSTISTEVQKLKRKLGIERRGCGFNALRHCVETFGGFDQTAINVLMGHVDPHISSEYREIISFPEQRLVGVTNTIRVWLGHPKTTETE